MTKEDIFQEALNELKQKRLKAEFEAKQYKQFVYENIPGAKELFNELTDLKIKKAKAEVQEKLLKELDAEIEKTQNLLNLECEKFVSADKVDTFIELLKTKNVQNFLKIIEKQNLTNLNSDIEKLIETNEVQQFIELIEVQNE